MECLRTNATPPALWLYKRRAPILRRHRHKNCAGSFMASWRVAVRAASKSLSNRWIVKWQSFFFFFPLISYNLRNRIDRFLSFATATFPNHVCKRIWKYWRLTVVIVLLLMLWSLRFNVQLKLLFIDRRWRALCKWVWALNNTSQTSKPRMSEVHVTCELQFSLTAAEFLKFCGFPVLQVHVQVPQHKHQDRIYGPVQREESEARGARVPREASAAPDLPADHQHSRKHCSPNESSAIAYWHH